MNPNGLRWKCPYCGSTSSEYPAWLGHDCPRCSHSVLVQMCPECGNEIDPDVCWCGVEKKDHDYEEHNFVPMGCDCGRMKI